VSVPDFCCQYNDVSNQQDATTFSFINLFNSALHVSVDKFDHPQEYFLTVYTLLHISGDKFDHPQEHFLTYIQSYMFQATNSPILGSTF